MISIIIPVAQQSKQIPTLITHLAEQPGSGEVILAGRSDIVSDYQDWASIAPIEQDTLQARLNGGAEAAQGEVLLFLLPHHRLPPRALVAIEQNFKLLPQTVGGSFHLKFRSGGPLAWFVARHLHHERYDGLYYLHSGLFVRREIFFELGGFSRKISPARADFSRRLEAIGPTLYLPDHITAALPDVDTILRWLMAKTYD